MAKYTYKIDLGDGSGLVSFQPDADAVYEYNKEDETHGFMRRQIGEMTISKDYDDEGTKINSDVFDTLWQYYFDLTKHTTEITINIYKNGVLDYSSVFYAPEGNINVNTGSYSIKPKQDDLYKYILAVADNEVDIITGYGEYAAILNVDSVAEEGTGAEGTGASDDYPFNDSAAPDDVWNSTWIQDPHTPTKWWRQKSLYKLWSGQGVFISDYYYYPDLFVESASFEFPNCFLLTERIQYMLDELFPAGHPLSGIQFVSNFFNDEINYVTGRENTLMNTLIEQRSDTKDPDATNKAHIGLISLNKIMEDLRAMFKVKWFIDDDGNFRIEHDKFFYSGLSTSGTPAIEPDLTDAAKYKDIASGEYYLAESLVYETIQKERVGEESIVFFDADTNDFRSDRNYISYDVENVDESRRDARVNLISTDVAKAINYPERLDDDGFYLFNCNEMYNIIELIEVAGDPTYDYVANAGFSVKWLLYDFYRYYVQDSSASLTVEGSVGDVSGTFPAWDFEATESIIVQKDIVFLLNDEDEIDVNKYIATYLIKSDGLKYKENGRIITAQHDLYDDFVTVTLGYEL